MRRGVWFLAMFVAISGCNFDEKEKTKITKSGDLFVPGDLEVTLWAQSPMLNNPTNMDVDTKGRIWVTEAVNYRNYRNNDSFFLHRAKGDRFVILEDRDNDGKAE